MKWYAIFIQTGKEEKVKTMIYQLIGKKKILLFAKKKGSRKEKWQNR